MPPAGLDALQHVVVLMMENRSFDHMLGALRARDARIDGFPADWANPDVNGRAIKAQAKAKYQSQLDPDPNHHFAAVDKQIFNGGVTPSMQGFVRSYYDQQQDAAQSQKIMYYFRPTQLPVLSNLALEYAVFNAWFASIPGPTLCNRAFAHYGTSFGHVGMELNYLNRKYKSVYERLIASGHTTKLYYYDRASSTMELVNLLQDQPQIFATYDQFLADCHAGTLPQYSFVEPNYSDHDGIIASDQHPDHHVGEGERFIASIYMAIKSNPLLWNSTALLIVYDEHGGIFDHVSPAQCAVPDEFSASGADTGTGQAFNFDRFGVRVPAVLVSPWIPKNTVVDSARTFEHASIPATVMRWLVPAFPNAQRSPREAAADTFLDLLTLPMVRTDGPNFA